MNQCFFRSNRAGIRGLLPRTAGKAAVAAAFMTGSIAAGSLAAADEPTAEELLGQIQKLQEQVQSLHTRQAAPASEKAAVARVLDDAEHRSATPMLVQDDLNPFLAGYDGRFVLRDAAGNFEFSPTAMMQFRAVTNVNNEGEDSFETIDFGIEIRRAKLGATGHAFTPDLNYHFEFGFDRTNGSAQLETAVVEWVPTGEGGTMPAGLGVRVGQFKDMTFYEEHVHPTRQLAAERSLVNEVLGGGNFKYIQGFGPVYRQDQFSAAFFYTAPGNSPWEDMTIDYGLAARVDFLAMGSRRDARDFTARGTDENLLRFGAGGHWVAAGDDRALFHSVDGQFETAGGLGVFAAFYGVWAELDGGDNDFYNIGAVVQLSQTLGRDLEVFARYGLILFDNEQAGPGGDPEDTFHEITVGLNQYYYGHRVKLTVDVNYLPNGNPGNAGNLGYQPNVGQFDDQVALRGQLQFAL